MINDNDNKQTSTSREPLRGRHWWSRVWWFYVDGFRSMTLGRTLWAIIAIKVVVFFVIIKWLFFPDFLASKADTDEGKAEYVRERLQRDTVTGPLNSPKGDFPLRTESREPRAKS